MLYCYYFLVVLIIFVIGLVILGLIVAVSHAHGFLVGQATGMMSRIMMTAAIYKKVRGYI